MDMTIEKVTHLNELLLNRYAIANGPEHDNSFLPGRDFGLTPDHPADCNAANCLWQSSFSGAPYCTYP